ncbi:MAG: PqqD family protein [Longimicrobiales bacterium]
MPEAQPPRGREDVVFRQLADDWVLFDPTANQIHVLNLSAALVWSSCTGEFSVDQIVDEVARSYGKGSDVDQIKDDVTGAVEKFTSEGLLE